MTALASRHERIRRTAELAATAQQAAGRIRTGTQVRLAPELAQAADAFRVAAEELARRAADELVTLESTRSVEDEP